MRRLCAVEGMSYVMDSYPEWSTLRISKSYISKNTIGTEFGVCQYIPKYYCKNLFIAEYFA